MAEQAKPISLLGEIWPGNDVVTAQGRFARMSGLGALGSFLLKHSVRGAVTGILGAEVLGLGAVETTQAAVFGGIIDILQASYRLGK